MFSKIKQMLDMPSAWREAEPKATEKVLHVTLPKDYEFMVSNRFLIDPINLEKKKPKVSKWVDDVNSIPLKIIIEAQADGSIEPWWDITMTYANGYTDKMKAKYKSRSGYIDYEPMRKVFKCILKNWRER